MTLPVLAAPTADRRPWTGRRVGGVADRKDSPYYLAAPRNAPVDTVNDPAAVVEPASATLAVDVQPIAAVARDRLANTQAGHCPASTPRIPALKRRSYPVLSFGNPAGDTMQMGIAPPRPHCGRRHVIDAAGH